MLPFLKEGDWVRIACVEPRSLRLGDVIAFWRGEAIVVHRFAGWCPGHRQLKEKGDNLRCWNPVPVENLLGRVESVRRASGEQRLASAWPRLRNWSLGLRAWCFCLAFQPARQLWRWLRRAP
jgi:hypothetical protein